MFCCGLMEDPTPLVEHCYEMFIEIERNELGAGEIDIEGERQLEAQGKNPGDTSLFKSLYSESKVTLPGHPLHNKYINRYNQLYYDDAAPVYTPSQYYKFANMKEDIVLEHSGSEAEIPECMMDITDPDESVRKSLLTTCRTISEVQAVADLRMEEVRCEDLTAADAPRISGNVRSVCLIRCALPVSYLRSIVNQLLDCGATLQRLDMSYMDLSGAEKDLDELLERIVSLHERGEAQSSLILCMIGIENEWTNLSQEFKQKWNKRCKKVKSIDSRIYDD